MYSEAGAAQLNTVHELWRHNSMQELPGLHYWGLEPGLEVLGFMGLVVFRGFSRV